MKLPASLGRAWGELGACSLGLLAVSLAEKGGGVFALSGALEAGV